MSNKKYSLLYPLEFAEYKKLSPTALHDLGLDQICKQLTPKESEQNLIMNTMSKLCADPFVTQYRCDIFEDMIHHKEMRESLMKILDKINFLKDYGCLSKEYEEHATVWDLLHRLDEINDYIDCVDAIYHCLENKEIHSQGLVGLRDYVKELYHSNGFGELRKDISELKIHTSRVRSITVGINLNDRFEADAVGLLSINSKPFTKAGVLGSFYDHITSKDKINESTEWKENYKFQQIEAGDSNAVTEAMFKVGNLNAMAGNPINAAIGISAIADNDPSRDVTRYMDRIVNHMISGMVRKIRETLNKYVSITITDMTDLIPELLYYIKWAEYMEKLKQKGVRLVKPTVASKQTEDADTDFTMKAVGIYNLKLVAADDADMTNVVTNDLIFDREHRVYVLTGANRGGKTTITQSIGQLFVLAQGGIYVPGEAFCFAPADNIYTHFPADEDKTFDLGRLGEECKRFKEMYADATKHSLFLMNETFSTTSFEEGYYIARDSVRAILKKGMRTIYNTHMHKLAFDIDEINEEDYDGKAFSLVVHNEGEKRSYKIEIAPPIGKSFASDIARKYGVTYEMLTEDKLV